MCVMMYKPLNTAILTKATYKRCWEKNDDGAGIAVWNNRSKLWEVEKGLMSFDAFWERFMQVKDPFKKAIFIHFRVGTAGPLVKPGLTHPFPVVNDYDKMRELKFKVKNFAAHNGTIGPGTTTESDTMMGVKDFLHPLHHLIRTNPEEEMNPVYEHIMAVLLDTKVSRWFITWGHAVTMFGPWIFDEGLGHHFSNEDYKEDLKNTWYKGKWHGDTTTIKRTRNPIRYVLNNDVIIYLDAEGTWDWAVWKRIHGYSWETKRQQNNGNTKTDTDKKKVDAGLVMAILNDDGTVEWSEDGFDQDDKEMLSCPLCASDDLLEWDKTKLQTACHTCGTIFNERTGEILDNKEEVTTWLPATCMYCETEIFLGKDSTECPSCGALLDPSDFKLDGDDKKEATYDGAEGIQ